MKNKMTIIGQFRNHILSEFLENEISSSITSLLYYVQYFKKSSLINKVNL